MHLLSGHAASGRRPATPTRHPAARRGANGDDLIGLAPAPGSALPGAAFVAPNAPEPS
jgi:hypothetical protein